MSDPLSVRTHVAVYVEEALYKEVYRMNEGDLVEVGPFVVCVVLLLWGHICVVITVVAFGVVNLDAVCCAQCVVCC